jgi:hypothetical protein
MVVDTGDPEARGRLRLLVPDIFGPVASSWAEACLGEPPGSAILPPVGAAVWAEFEGGDVDRPIWSGYRWPLPGAATDRILQSPGGHAIVVSDRPPTPTAGGIVLDGGGATIVVNASGIYLDNGRGASVALIGPTTLVNGDALTVT